MNIFRNSAMLALILSAFTVASCDKKGTGTPVSPIFPDVTIEENLAPGQILEITFTPNLKCTATIPVEAFEWFKFKNDNFHYREIEGEAGEPLTLLVEVSSVEEQLQGRSCEISLTMGGQTQTLAVLARPAKQKSITVKSALHDNGVFQYAEDGYLYSDSVSSVELVWTGTDFRIPIKVDANFSWTVQFPEWLKGDVPKVRFGTSMFNLYGVSTELPLEETEGNIIFKNGDEDVLTLNIKIPGCKDVFSYDVAMGLSVLEFSSQGYLKSAAGYIQQPATVTMFGPDGVKVKVMGKIGGVYRMPDPLWCTVSIADYVDGMDVLQSRDVKITMKENTTSNDREAYVFFLPSTASDELTYKELFESDQVTVKQEYAQYSVKLIQYVAFAEYIEPDSTPMERALKAVTYEKIDDLFHITYAKTWSQDEGYLHLATPCAKVKVYDHTHTLMAEDAIASNWCRFDMMETGMYGRIVVDADKIPAENAVAYFEFVDSSASTLAEIKFAFDPDKIPELEDVSTEVKFADDYEAIAKNAGASLVQVTEGLIYNEFKEYQCPIYHLSYTQTGIPMKITLPITATCYYPNPYEYRHYLLVNDLDVDEHIGAMELIDGGVFIYMSMPDDIKTEADANNEDVYRFEGCLLFYNARTATSASNDNLSFILYCTLTLPADVN